jgi:hypothetical protein
MYDQDDKEADEIWEAVDLYMDERRRVRAALSSLSLLLHAHPCACACPAADDIFGNLRPPA